MGEERPTLVWAKLDRYPWWPGVLLKTEKPRSGRWRVLFLATYDHADVKKECVVEVTTENLQDAEYRKLPLKKYRQMLAYAWAEADNYFYMKQLPPALEAGLDVATGDIPSKKERAKRRLIQSTLEFAATPSHKEVAVTPSRGERSRDSKHVVRDRVLLHLALVPPNDAQRVYDTGNLFL